MSLATRSPIRQPQPSHLFRLTLAEVVFIFPVPEGEHMLIDVWRPGKPLTRFERTISDPPRRVDYDPHDMPATAPG